MRILLTGGEGFIGSAFYNKLHNKYDIVKYNDNIRYFTGHLTNTLSFYDVVVHLAALVGVRSSWKDPVGYWETNVTASKKIFNWASNNNVRIIYASSSSIYEWWLNPYAASKKAMEEVAPAYSTGMRFHTVWGPNSRTDMFYDMMLKGKLDYLTTHERDFTHVDDVVNAIDILIQTSCTPKYVDIGTGTVFKVTDIAKKYGYGHLPIRETTGERLHTKADNSYMRSLGWEPTKYII